MPRPKSMVVWIQFDQRHEAVSLGPLIRPVVNRVGDRFVNVTFTERLVGAECGRLAGRVSLFVVGLVTTVAEHFWENMDQHRSEGWETGTHHGDVDFDDRPVHDRLKLD